jgi:hypothetical protein
MLPVYQQLLRLYPAEYREQFSEEMIAVLQDLCREIGDEKPIKRGLFWAREITGLMSGAAREHWHALLGPHARRSLPRRRFTMRNGFRFPTATIVFMALILACVVTAIKKGENIAASLPHVSPPIGPIQPAHSTLLPPIALLLAAFYLAGLIGWAILFAFHRSGVHRLDEISSAQK